MKLEMQQVIVFGGSSGIGLATARRALAEGASVTLVGTSQERLGAAAAALGTPVRTRVCDVHDEGAVERVFEDFTSVDHVVNTAGGVGGAPKLQGPMAVLMEPIQTRLQGSIAIAKHAIPKLRAGGSVTFFSGAGQSKPFPASATTLASAGAVEILSRALAVEAAPIRFNTISPGLVDTPLLRSFFPDNAEESIAAWSSKFPVPRAAQADEVADAVSFLMTNVYMTGETLVIDGGWRWT
jgi:NAD(P)-dependent dehydrogenase (short-subunit alcohol dehydrogenase family)